MRIVKLLVFSFIFYLPLPYQSSKIMETWRYFYHADHLGSTSGDGQCEEWGAILRVFTLWRTLYRPTEYNVEQPLYL